MVGSQKLDEKWEPSCFLPQIALCILLSSYPATLCTFLPTILSTPAAFTNVIQLHLEVYLEYFPFAPYILSEPPDSSIFWLISNITSSRKLSFIFPNSNQTKALFVWISLSLGLCISHDHFFLHISPPLPVYLNVGVCKRFHPQVFVSHYSILPSQPYPHSKLYLSLLCALVPAISPSPAQPYY